MVTRQPVCLLPLPSIDAQLKVMKVRLKKKWLLHNKSMWTCVPACTRQCLRTCTTPSDVTCKGYMQRLLGPLIPELQSCTFLIFIFSLARSLQMRSNKLIFTFSQEKKNNLISLFLNIFPWKRLKNHRNVTLTVWQWGSIGSLLFASVSKCGDFSTVLFPGSCSLCLGSAAAAIFITPHLVAEGRHAWDPTVGRPVSLCQLTLR